MFLHKKRKVCILCLLRRIFIAMSVYCNNSVCILIYNDSIRIHTKCSDFIFKLLCSVDDLTFIQFICKVWENNCRKLHTDSDIYTVGFCCDVKILTHFLHPFASTSSYRNDTFLTLIYTIFCDHTISTVNRFHIIYMAVKTELYRIFQLCIKIFKNNIVDICSKMADRCIQKIQLILHTEFLNMCSWCRIHFCTLTTEFHIDFINIIHQIDCCFFSNVLIQCSTKIVRDIVFSIWKCSCSAESTHNRACLAVHAALNLLSVDWAFSLLQWISGLKNRHLQFRCFLCQLVSCKDSPRSCTDNNYIIIAHIFFSFQLLSCFLTTLLFVS